MVERDIQRACLDYLSLKGIVAWRSNQIPVPLKDGGFSRFAGRRGVSDILGIIPQTVRVVGYDEPQTFGNFLAVECKTPAGRLTKEQAEFLAEIERLGGIAIVARSVDELESKLLPYT